MTYSHPCRHNNSSQVECIFTKFGTHMLQTIAKDEFELGGRTVFLYSKGCKKAYLEFENCLYSIIQVKCTSYLYSMQFIVLNHCLLEFSFRFAFHPTISMNSTKCWQSPVFKTFSFACSYSLGPSGTCINISILFQTPYIKEERAGATSEEG